MPDREYKTSEAKRRNNRAWDQANRRVYSCKVDTETAEKFDAYLKERNRRPSEFLKSYIERCLAEDKASKERESGG